MTNIQRLMVGAVDPACRDAGRDVLTAACAGIMWAAGAPRERTSCIQSAVGCTERAPTWAASPDARAARAHCIAAPFLRRRMLGCLACTRWIDQLAYMPFDTSIRLHSGHHQTPSFATVWLQLGSDTIGIRCPPQQSAMSGVYHSQTADTCTQRARSISNDSRKFIASSVYWEYFASDGGEPARGDERRARKSIRTTLRTWWCIAGIEAATLRRRQRHPCHLPCPSGRRSNVRSSGKGCAASNILLRLYQGRLRAPGLP